MSYPTRAVFTIIEVFALFILFLSSFLNPFVILIGSFIFLMKYIIAWFYERGYWNTFGIIVGFLLFFFVGPGLWLLVWWLVLFYLIFAIILGFSEL